MTVEPTSISLGERITVRGQLSEPFPAHNMGLVLWLIADESYTLMDQVCRATPKDDGTFACEFTTGKAGGRTPLARVTTSSA